MCEVNWAFTCWCNNSWRWRHGVATCRSRSAWYWFRCTLWTMLCEKGKCSETRCGTTCQLTISSGSWGSCMSAPDIVHDFIAQAQAWVSKIAFYNAGWNRRPGTARGVWCCGISWCNVGWPSLRTPPEWPCRGANSDDPPAYHPSCSWAEGAFSKSPGRVGGTRGGMASSQETWMAINEDLTRVRGALRSRQQILGALVHSWRSFGVLYGWFTRTGVAYY